MLGVTAIDNLAKSCSKIFRISCGILERLKHKSVSFPEDYEALNFEDDKNIQRKKSNFIVPVIGEVNRQNFQTAVGLYLTHSTVAWAKLSRDNLLMEWNIVPMEVNVKRWHISSVYETVRGIFPLLPKADLYVLEDLKKPSASQLANPLMVSNIRLMECTMSMVYLHLNYLLKNLQESGDVNQHNVFFLQSHIASRLSATNLGNERISGEDVVMEILKSSESSNKVHQFTPIKISIDVNETFFDRTSVERECLYRALLLVMSFMDLVVRGRRESLQFVNKRE